MRMDLLKRLIPLAFDPTQVDVERQRIDYPNVTAWDQDEKLDASESDLAEKVRYLQHGNGQPLDKARIKLIRADLRNVFQQIKKFMPSALEDTRTKHDDDFMTTIFRYMRLKYPEFTLCDDNWKLNSFVSNWYGNWRKNLKDGVKKQAVKQEQADSCTIPSKRHAQNLVSPPVQRQKLNIKKPLYISHPFNYAC